MNQVCLSVDVGYGNVKACWGAECDSTSEIIFRAIAIPVHKGTEIFESNGTVAVTVGNDVFKVGPKAYLSGGNGVPDSNFVDRPEYLAFLRGAMHFMFCQKGVFHTIDTLAVGLPVGNFAKDRNKLKAICIGEHVVATPPSLIQQFGPTVKINVKKVVIVPQPIGALSIFQRKCARANKEMGSALIIDPGYKTLGTSQKSRH